MSARRIQRRGGTFVGDLLLLTAVAMAVIVAAYVYMPDFERGVHAVAGWIENLLFPQ